MIPTSFTTISDLRFKTKEVLARAAKKPVIILHRAEPRGVILSVAEFEEIMSNLEDYYLSKRAEELIKKDNKSTVRWITDKKLRKDLHME